MNILKELYYGNINELDRKTRPMPNPLTDKELLTYQKLKDTLSKEDFELFSQYIDLFQKRVDKDLEEKYIQGFKTGLQIGIESSKIKL